MRISDWSSDVCSSDLSLLNHNLKLDRAQQTQMDEIESRFAIRRQALELELRADNARLADAIQAEHGYGPAVGAAIDRSHQAMGELQKETLEHDFARRADRKSTGLNSSH